ncbi:MAG: galactose mutarotase [Spirochaetaceae bacterium]|jgi:aldose 1-epimerase|nr:galactose mutarotase [Spirochaetaceae bacterium]
MISLLLRIDTSKEIRLLSLIMSISTKTLGVLTSGEEVFLYFLREDGMTLALSSMGASIISIIIPTTKKGLCDICLGYSTLEAYTQNNGFLGVTVGRFANRIGGSAFKLNGKIYNLYNNENGNSLHGGRRGFDKRVWKSTPRIERNGSFVTFELDSPANDEGYPGNLKASVTYGLNKSHEIIAEYSATVDAPSPINLTNHTYFNLAGEGTGNILSHKARIYASSYAEIDNLLIPTGRLLPVSGTPFDFLEPKTFGRDIVHTGNGYDHCYAIDGEAGTLRSCAEIFEENSGITMRVSTTQPGCQLYTGNSLHNVAGKLGSIYNKYSGFCLETQNFPDSPNRTEFPSSIFGPERPYHEKTVFAFSW